ncbi:hypothetical protein L218DRAFT_877091, partial [Marasmius fiardii PR-910]
QKPNITQTYEERVAIASASLDKGMGMIGSDGKFNDTARDDDRLPTLLLSQMAEFDMITQGGRYKTFLMEWFSKTPVDTSIRTLILYLKLLLYGYTAGRAYLAYKDDNLLTIAEKSWDLGRAYTVTENDVAAGKLAANSIPITKDCFGSKLLT